MTENQYYHGQPKSEYEIREDIQRAYAEGDDIFVDLLGNVYNGQEMASDELDNIKDVIFSIIDPEDFDDVSEFATAVFDAIKKGSEKGQEYIDRALEFDTDYEDEDN